MKKHMGWNYTPYTPPFFSSGDIYICRLVPSPDSIYLEWLQLENAGSYEIFYRERNIGEFISAGSTTDTNFTITPLATEKEYEFYVEAKCKKSLIRLARTGESIGTVVNYLHPEDKAYSFSGHCLCSPSFVRHPDGHLLSSMDIFAGDQPQNLTLIFRSDDDGKTWHYVCELYPCFWGKLFIHKGEVYMLACSTEYRDLLVGKSSDGGNTWTEPVVLLRGAGPIHGGVHKNPQPVVEFNGRLWNTIEWLTPAYLNENHAPMVISIPADADLLEATNWSFSEPLLYNPEWPGVAKGKTYGNIEGCLTVINDELYSIMRYDICLDAVPNYGLVLCFKVDTENPENPLKFDRAIEFPGNRSKFSIKYDEVSQKYYSIATRFEDPMKSARNILTLMVSDDAVHWSMLKDLHDRRDLPVQEAGFQYVDFMFEGEDLIYICRTALNKPENFHNSNYQTFHRIENFRKLVKNAVELEIFHVN